MKNYKKIELTKEEQNEILGGGTQFILPPDDVKNSNTTSGCYCSYNNNSVIQNTNSVDGCQCECV